MPHPDYLRFGYVINVCIYLSEISCGEPLNISHSSWTSTGNKFEDTVTYMCDTGYEWLNGSGPLLRRCEASRLWSDLRPVCERQYHVPRAFYCHSLTQQTRDLHPMAQH